MDSLILRDNAILIDIPVKLNRDSKITFICHCSNQSINTFRYIVKCNGLHCNKCSKKMGDNKRKCTVLKKYGVEFLSHSKEIQEKIKDTNLERYGVDNVFKNKDIRNKIKNTMLDKYGTEYSIQNKEIQNIINMKSRKTHLERYGVEYSIQNKHIFEKRKMNNILKYGVENPMQNIDIQNKLQKNSKNFKEYVMPSGIIRKVQGYEPFALDILLQSYTEDQLKTDRKDVPRIKYIVNEKDKYYFPDIYIPHENKIIEVKSKWTLNLHKDIVNNKKQACIDQGYNYEIWCFNSKEELIDV